MYIMPSNGEGVTFSAWHTQVVKYTDMGYHPKETTASVHSQLIFLFINHWGDVSSLA